MPQPLIAIDGPAGAGKTSTSRAVANRLGVPYLDTGGMYRAVTYAVMSRNLTPNDGAALKTMLDRVDFKYAQGSEGVHFWVDGVDVTDRIRDPELDVGVRVANILKAKT